MADLASWSRLMPSSQLVRGDDEHHGGQEQRGQQAKHGDAGEGGVEALGLIADKLELGGSFWTMVGNLNDHLGNFGYLVIAIFVGGWIVSYLIYRWQGFDRPAVERG